jgi:NADH-quinone oxidoreductase subunit F
MGKQKPTSLEKLARHREPCLAICVDKDCARNGAKQNIHAAQAALEAAGLHEQYSVALTKCQDHCDDAPALTVLPGFYPYIELEPDDIARIVQEHLSEQRPVLELLHKRMRKRLKKLTDSSAPAT